MLQNFFTTKTDAQLVEEIHNEFDAAQDRLLQQAKAIIESNNSLSNKAERLKNIGFTASELVLENENKKSILVKNREQANLIEYYKMHYPFQKFLTEGELNRICNKYNLIYAPISAYKKDVPDKNITEIEKAKPLENTLAPEDVLKCKLNFHTWLVPTGGDFLHIWSIWRYVLPSVIDGNYSSEYKVNAILNNKYNTGIQYLVTDIENIKFNRQGLFIAAPKSHFNKKGLMKNGELGMFNYSITVPKDPIVFRYCKGGIQVLSKWGLEASDEGLINEILN